MAKRKNKKINGGSDSMETHDFIEDNLLMLSAQTMGEMLKCKNSDVISVYLFYYYTAKWQKTNQPKATNEYVHRGLNISIDRIKRAKDMLIAMGLIESINRKTAEGRITGWYVKVKYLWKGDTVKSILPMQAIEKTRGVENHSVDNPECGNPETNALSVSNINALSVNKEMLPPPKVDGSQEAKNKGFSLKDMLGVYADLYKRKYGTFPRVTAWGQMGTLFKSLSNDFTENQVYLLIATYMGWKGATGNDMAMEKRLQSNCYPLGWINYHINAIVPYIVNTLGIKWGDEDKVAKEVRALKLPYLEKKLLK